ncbi:MAG: GGDEF domain-containing protein [Rhodocyclales bacterium]|nr:GGDEF domain-containing protein [Rhodocyclales bacterium]
MNHHHRLFGRHRLLLVLGLLLTAGFLTTSILSYQVSKAAIREAIMAQDLPLTSSNIYSEIQKDLVRPVLVSSTMAHDTFLRNWVLRGERNVGEIARYLQEIRERHGAFSSFFVSDRTGNYYTGKGIHRRIAPDKPEDAWYRRVRAMGADYEINVDPDYANQNALTIFVNYRTYDFDGRFIGATGVGLTVDAVRRLIAEHQQRFQRTIYFVDQQGRTVLVGDDTRRQSDDLRQAEGLGPLIDGILRDKSGSYRYVAAGDSHVLNVNYLPELNWYLFVEQNEDISLAGIRRTLAINIAISLVMTLVVLTLIHLATFRYQRRIETMAATDELTGLANRHAFNILADKLLADVRREPRPISLLLIDIDRFKEINDRHGHRIGDDVLATAADAMRGSLRESDIAARWGGEELLVLLKGSDLAQATQIAEKLRQLVERAPIEARGHAIPVTVSIGVTQHLADESMDDTIARADRGLYEAKRGGRNRVCVVAAAAA